MASTTGVILAGILIAASAASGAEPGQLGIQLGVGGTRSTERFGYGGLDSNLAFSYQFTDRFSLRPSLALGHSSSRGWFGGLGGTAVYHLRPGKHLRPYVGAGLTYRTRDPFGTAQPATIEGLDLTIPPDESSRHYLTFGFLAGVEYSISRRLSLFAELDGAFRTGHHYRYDGSAVQLRRDAFAVRPLVGLTLKLR